MKKNGRNMTISSFIVVILLFSSLLAGCKKEAEVASDSVVEESVPYETLSESNAKKFSYEDLIVDQVKIGMTEDEIIAKLGQPANIYDSKEVVADKEKQSATQSDTVATQSENVEDTDVLDEMIYAYNDLTLIFMPVDGAYTLCAAASVGDNDTFARGIKVGDSKERISELFYRDSNCLNNNVMSEDNQTIIGKYLYGDFTIDNIENKKISDKIEYGIINYNGNTSYEEGKSYIIEYTYFEPPYLSGNASVNDDFAQIAFDIDEKGIISGIRWYYYPEVKE